MNKSNISTLVLASAMLAITFNHSFEWWCNNDPLASSRNIDARKVWSIACRKAKKHTSTNPDPQPLPPAPAAPAPSATVPSIKRMATIKLQAA